MSLFNKTNLQTAAVTPIQPVQAVQAVQPVMPVQQAPTNARPKRPAPDAWGNIEIVKSDESSDWLRNKFIRIDADDSNPVEKEILAAAELAFAAHEAEGKSPETFDYSIDCKLHINPGNGTTATQPTGAFIASTVKK